MSRLPYVRAPLTMASRLLSLLVLSLLLFVPAAAASPVTVTSFTGAFAGDDDVFVASFTLVGAGTVSARTFSFGGGINANGDVIAPGGFAPVLSLFLGTGTEDLLQVAAGSVNSCPSVGAADPITGFCWDAFFSTTLPAGEYLVALSQDDNIPVGSSLFDGFSRTGNPNYTGTDFLGDSTRSFILVTGAQRDAGWAFDLSVPSETSGPPGPPTVPEPASLLLLWTGLAGAVWSRRRRRN